MTVVGVAPRGFDGTTLGAAATSSCRSRCAADVAGLKGFENRRSYWVYLFARLKPGVSIERRRGDQRHLPPIINDVEAPLQQGMSDQTMARFRAKEAALAAGARARAPLHGEAQTPLILLLRASPASCC